MAKKMNVRTDVNVHGGKNPLYLAGGQHVEIERLVVTLMMALSALASFIMKLAPGDNAPTTDEGVTNAIKSIHRQRILSGDCEHIPFPPKGGTEHREKALAILLSLGWTIEVPQTETVAAPETVAPPVETTELSVVDTAAPFRADDTTPPKLTRVERKALARS